MGNKKREGELEKLTVDVQKLIPVCAK